MSDLKLLDGVKVVDMSAFVAAPMAAEILAEYGADVVRIEPLTGDGLTVQVTLRQGVYHQIKRMFGVFDAGVNALHRESIGGVALDPALAPGQWRELTAEEVERLRTR